MASSAADPLFTEEHEMLRVQLRRFVEQEIRPHAGQWEQDGMVPRDVLTRMGALGFLGVRWPEALGGAGMDARASVVLAEELGRSGFGGFAITVLVHTDMAGPHLLHAGNAAQHAKWAPGVIAGETICAVCVTEPGAGSDVAGMKTRARRDGDDWVIDGGKIYITNGVHAGLYFIAARTDPDVKPSRGVSIFAVEAGASGLEVSRKLDKTGWLSSDTAELRFDRLRVPAANMLGEENGGFRAIMRNFQTERLVLGAQVVGECQRALEITLDWVKTRDAFGAKLWDRQAIRQRLAQRWAEVEAARALVHRAAWLDAAGRDCVKEVSAIKALCGELVNRVMYDCVQFHGGAGYMRGTEIERMARDARVQAIGGGASEVMLEEVAKRM